MSLLTVLGLKPRTSAPAPAPGPGSIAPGQQAGGSGPMPPPPVVDKNLAAYQSARAAVQKLADDLNAHPQKAKIAANIANAMAKLSSADTFAAAKDYAKATQALAEAKAICVAAKKLADDWATYARQRADALALAMAFGSADFNWKAWANPKLAAADAFANATPPDFANAAKKLKDEINKVGEPVVKKGIANAKAKLALIEKTSKAAQAFAKAQIDEGKTYIANAEAAMAARDWSVSQQNSSSAMRLLGPASRTCERRAGYDTQRAATVAAVAKVRAEPLLKARADALDKQVGGADALAAPDTLKIEAGVAALQATAKQAEMWSGLAKTLATHAKERAGAEAELAALDKHAAAAKITTQRDAIRKILADAKALAATAETAADPVATWSTVLAEVARARTDLAATAKLAESLGASSAAEAAAAKPGDIKGLKAALDKLQADGKAAQKAATAAGAVTELVTFDTQAKAAAASLAKNDGATAAKALAAAAAALAAAKGIAAGHQQYEALLATVEAQLATLKKSPRAALIKARLDPIDAALAEAKAKDQAHAGTEALAAARRASDALAPAKAADAERERYDTHAAELGKRVDKIADATEKAALVALVGNAKKDADALKLGDAEKALDQIEVRLDKGQAEALMKAPKVDSKALAKLAAKMVGKGGAATIDKMIHDIPNGSDPAAMNALAEGRYGVKFKTDKPLAAVPGGGGVAPIPAGDPVKAMREVCDMFAKIPQDIVKSPSVKGVEYSDKVGSAGGSFSYDDAKVRMVGRPGIPQRFGAAQQNQDPKTGAWVAQLPATIDANCQPKNTTAVEYLGFAAAHEVGHSLDDSTGFMAGRGIQEKYGGWTTFGASVQPIADAVGADARFSAFYKTPQQKQYVLDKLLNKPTTPPAAVLNSPEDLARKAFDNWYSIATSANVYRRQGDCVAIKVGDYVYHEAYARQWVRYLFAARSKALTGYQFRAPGEWFAELYAGFRSNKLKDDHPAMEWLKKL